MKLLDTAKQWTQIKGSFNNILFSKFNQEKYLTQRAISLVTYDKPINLWLKKVQEWRGFEPMTSTIPMTRIFFQSLGFNLTSA